MMMRGLQSLRERPANLRRVNKSDEGKREPKKKNKKEKTIQRERPDERV